MCPLVMSGDFKGTTGTGGSFFENQRNIFANQFGLLGAVVLRPFQIAGQIEQIADFPFRVMYQTKQMTVFQIKGHGNSPDC